MIPFYWRNNLSSTSIRNSSQIHSFLEFAQHCPVFKAAWTSECCVTAVWELSSQSMLRSTWHTTICSGWRNRGWGEGNSLEAWKVQNLVPPGRISVHGLKRLVYKGNHSKGSELQFQSWKITVIGNLSFQKYGHKTSRGTHHYFYFQNSSI